MTFEVILINTQIFQFNKLRRRVTSPGGTTERAIGIMEDNNLRQIFAQAMQGAYQRSKELSD